MATSYYYPDKHIYINKLGIYSEEEIEYADQLEKHWKSTLPHYTFYQLLEIFPEARGAMKRNLLAEIKQCKQDLLAARSLENEYTYKIIPGAPAEQRWFFFALRDVFTKELTIGREQKIKRNYFYLSALKQPATSPTTTGKITPADIARAKETPIDSLIEVNHSGVAHCPFHGKDRTPSLQVYKNTNRWWCFSCQQGTDVVDLFMKLNNCDFITAVKKLINK